MFPPYGFTEINGQYLIVVPQGVAIAVALGLAFLAALVPWLANLEQPTPRPSLWALSAADRENRRRR